jgi:hypothetical protein
VFAPSSDPGVTIDHFHDLVRDGSLDDLQFALTHGAPVNGSGRMGYTALMVAVSEGHPEIHIRLADARADAAKIKATKAAFLEKIKLLIQHGADLELTDDRNETALRHAVRSHFLEAISLLLSLGAEKGYRPKYPLKKVDSGFDFSETAKSRRSRVEPDGKTSSTPHLHKLIDEVAQNPKVKPIITTIQSVEVLKLFLAAGDDPSLAGTFVKRALVGLSFGGSFCSTPGDFQKHYSPRDGSSNPESMDFPFWREMIQVGYGAKLARQHFAPEDSPSKVPGKVWCYARSGASLTPLADGRFVQIGGQHGDYGDFEIKDFFIYNDVVIFDGRGNFHIYGYPQNDFPPTSFQTATSCPNGIYVIGGLGHGGHGQPRSSVTSVHRLLPESWQIEKVRTTGEMPGEIHQHHAVYDPERNAIRLLCGEIRTFGDDEKYKTTPNEHEYELRLSDFKWSRTK